jgi:hypothetical protein
MFFNMEGLKMRHHDEEEDVLLGQYNPNRMFAADETIISTSTVTTYTTQQTIQEDEGEISEGEEDLDLLDAAVADIDSGYEFEYQKQLLILNHQQQQHQQVYHQQRQQRHRHAQRRTTKLLPWQVIGGGIDIDPIVVDQMVANELNSLSMIHRERTSEEIHGVGSGRCPTDTDDDDLDGSFNSSSTPTSTSDDNEYIRKREENHALMKLQEELDKIYLSNNSTAYPAYYYARSHDSALLKDRGYRLSFLSTEGYSNPKKAAIRVVRHLDSIKDVYNTNNVLFRPIRLSDLDNTTAVDPAADDDDEEHDDTKNKKKTNKKKKHKNNNSKLYTAKRLLNEELFIQIMPVRDTSGRRIVVHISEPSQVHPITSKQGVAYYIDQSISNQNESDTTGAILVYFLHNVSSTMKSKKELQNIHLLFQTTRTKYSAIHLCCPNGPFYDTVKATYTLLVGKENRTRLRFHAGSYQECKYSLKSFGIPVERFPKTLFPNKSDNVIQKENQNHRKWISMQETLEYQIQNEINQKMKSGSGSNNSVQDSNSSTIEMDAYYKVRSKYIECAYHEDCLFGKGRPAMKHPGNVAMRRLLEEKFDRYNNTPSMQDQKKMKQQMNKTKTMKQQHKPSISSTGNMHMKTRIALEIVHEIKRGSGRFLKEVETTASASTNGTTTCVGVDYDGSTSKSTSGSASKSLTTTSGLLINVDDKAALQKIKVAFRDLKKRKIKEGTLLASSSPSPTPTPTIKSSLERESQLSQDGNTGGNTDDDVDNKNTITTMSSLKKRRAVSQSESSPIETSVGTTTYEEEGEEEGQQHQHYHLRRSTSTNNNNNKAAGTGKDCGNSGIITSLSSSAPTWSTSSSTRKKSRRLCINDSPKHNKNNHNDE